jgi:hypothetical protein
MAVYALSRVVQPPSRKRGRERRPVRRLTYE